MRANVTRAAEGFDRRSFTVAEILRMQDAGIVSEDENFELIEGEIVPMQAKTHIHELIKSALTIGLARALPDRLWLGVESTIYLSADTFVEPDLVIYPKGIKLEDVKGSDILLAIDGKPVTQFREVERAVVDKQSISVTIWRIDHEQTFSISTRALSGQDVDRVVQWAGATLQAPHRAISAQRGIAPQGVYVAYFQFGSPASRYGLVPGRRILEVDGQATPDVDAFLKLVVGRPDRSSLRIKTVSWNGAPEVITLKLDRHYWPAYELVRGAGGWERHSLE